MPDGPVGILTAVHPDFLPPLHAVAHMLARSGLPVDVFTFDSMAPGRTTMPVGVRVHELGSAAGTLRERNLARQRFRGAVTKWMTSTKVRALIAACPFSYLEALRQARKGIPVTYLVLELYDASWRAIRGSPRDGWTNRQALRRLREASLVCAPSSERAGWLLRAGNLQRLPEVVLNCPLYDDESASREQPWPEWLPPHFRGNPIVLNSGNAGPTHCVPDLISSVHEWPKNARLVVTNVADSAYGRSLRELARRSERADDIAVLPTVSREQVLQLQRLSTIGVCLIRRTAAPETLMPAPNKMAEYVHAGLTVLSFPNSIASRLAADAVAQVIDEREPVAIADGVRRALDLARTGDARARADHVARTWYCMQEQGLPVLRAVLGTRRGERESVDGLASGAVPGERRGSIAAGAR